MFHTNIFLFLAFLSNLILEKIVARGYDLKLKTYQIDADYCRFIKWFSM